MSEKKLKSDYKQLLKAEKAPGKGLSRDYIQERKKDIERQLKEDHGWPNHRIRNLRKGNL